MPKRANRRCSGFMIFSHLKHSAFTATRLEKGVPFKFVNRRYTIAVPFQLKVVYKRAATGVYQMVCTLWLAKTKWGRISCLRKQDGKNVFKLDQRS